jgi:hypothetical protein
MTNERSSARGPAGRTAPVARRLAAFAMTATMPLLSGCGDSGDDSEGDVSDAGCRAGGDWTTTSQYLTAPAAAALAAACGGLAPPGQPLPTGSNPGCADELVSVYIDRQTRTGTTAFSGYNHRRIDPSAAWAAQLLAGWTEADVTGFAEAARRQNLDAPQGAEQLRRPRTQPHCAWS